MDPVSLALGAVSLAIQLAEGVRTAFLFFESVVHANEECRSFAVRLAIEQARFEQWAEQSGLLESTSIAEQGTDTENNTKSSSTTSKSFQKLLLRNNNLIVPLLSELHLIMTQLSEKDGRYSEFTEISGPTRGVDPSPSQKEKTPSIPSIVDITDPVEVYAKQLSKSVMTLPYTLMAQESGSRLAPNRNKPPKSWKRIIGNVNLSTRHVTTALTQPKRWAWVIRDRRLCLAKLLRLSELNNFLLEALDQSQIENIFESMESFKMILTQVLTTTQENNIAVQDLKALAFASQVDPATVSADDLDSLLSGETLVNDREEHKISQISKPGKGEFMGQAAYFFLAVIDLRSSPIPDAVHADPGILHALGSHPRELHTKVLFKDKQLWVEWKSYSPIRAESGVPEKTKERMELLVSLLQMPTKPQEFCVPPCLGYFDDPDKSALGVVYEAPDGVAHPVPKTLSSCFALKNVPLTTRLSIAQKLAHWLLHLHAVRWLHKGIQSESVLFFSAKNSRDLGEPYMTGFEYSRAATNNPTPTTKIRDEVERNLYVDPDYLGPLRGLGYRKIYDIYSLGIILVELAYWQPISLIISEEMAAVKAAKSSPQERSDSDVKRSERQDTLALENWSAANFSKFRDDLLSGRFDILDRVTSLAGGKYHDVVKACLSGMAGFGMGDKKLSPESDMATSADLLSEFNDRVVVPLKNIVV